MTNEEFIKQFSGVTTKLADESLRTDKSWWGISRSVEHIGETIEKGWPAAMAKSFGKQSQIILGLDSISRWFKDPKMIDAHIAEMSKKHGAHNAELTRLRNREILGVASIEEIASIASHEREIGHLKTQMDLANKLKGIKLEGMTYLPVLLASVKQTAHFADQMQTALIQGNAALDERYRLMKDIAAVQRATGASAETLADATSAATRYGLEMRPTFEADLDIITKMKEGMGVSASESASLLASLRLMGRDSKGVADAIARIKADTGLAADEATRLAKQITMAMAVMAPGGNVSRVVETIGRLEGAAVQLGFASGKVMSMMEGWTKQSGLMGVGMLGLQPDFMKDQATAMMSFQKMVEFTEQQLKATEGNAYARQAVLEQFAEIFGTTTDVIARGRDILNEYNKQANTATTLQQEWQKQTSSFAKSWDKLKNQFAGLIHSALLPLVGVLQKVVDLLSSGITWLAETKGALWAVGGALTYGLGHTLWKLGFAIKPIISAFGHLTSLGGMMGKAAAHMPTFARFFSSIAGAGGPGLMGITRLFGAVGVAGTIGWTLGRLIGTTTGLDRTMQRMFTSKIFGITETKDDPMRPGSISQEKWWREIRKMSAAGIDETLIGKWAEENVKYITDVQKLLPELRERAAQKLQQNYIEERLLRQRMKEISAWPGDSEKVSEDAMKRTAILIEMEKLARIQAAAVREGTDEAKKEREEAKKAEEEQRALRSFSRITDRTTKRCY